MRPIQTIILLFFIFILSFSISAQNFSIIDHQWGTCHDPASALADLDNDGDLDVFFTGLNENGIPHYSMYRNNGNLDFTAFFPSVTPVSNGACAFGDMDNDGLADLALLGDDGNAVIAKIYRNGGNFTFTSINAGLTGLSEGSLAWGDYNHDGFADLLVSGLNSSGYPVTILYRNENGNTFVDEGLNFSGLYQSSISWYDIDGDLDLDFAVCGKDSSDLARTHIYIQDNGEFEKLGAGIAGLWGGQLDWGDYNNDGFADLVISGTSDAKISQTMVYKNIAGTSFSALAGPFNGVSDGSSFWGDFDNNGSLDFLVAGRYRSDAVPPPPPDDPFLEIYFNDGNGNFNAQPSDILPPERNSISTGDLDNDSDLDLLVTGTFISPIGGQGDITVIFSNNTTIINNPPAAPINLDYEEIDSYILQFGWQGSPDDHTPLEGLNYNLRLGTQSNNMDMMSAMAELSDGYRRIAGNGNASSLTGFLFSGIPFGEYFASVQSIDHSFAGSLFSASLHFLYLPTATFEVDDTACTDDLIMIVYTGNASDTATYNWDFGGATVMPGSGTGPGPHVVKWETPGIKTVSLTVIESGMSSDPVSKEVLVIDPVTAASSIEGETEFCQGTASTSYLASPVAGAISYLWGLVPVDAGTISVSGLEADIAWDPDFSGTAVLTVSGNNFCGPGPASDPLEITVSPKPGKPGTPDGPAALCKNPPNSEYTSSGATNAVAYAWEVIPDGSGDLTSNGTMATVNWNNSFTGEAGIIITAQNSCGNGPASDTLNIFIEVPPIADAGPDQEIEYLSTTQLLGSATGGSGDYTYYWTPAEFLIDPNVQDPITVPLDSSRVFKLRVEDMQSGCFDEDNMIVNVPSGPLYVSISALPLEACPGEEIQLLALAGGGNPPYSFTWTSDPPGFISNIAEPLAYPDATTTYYVEVMDSSETVTDSVKVTILPLPESPGPISGPVDVCAGDENITYSISAVPGATLYQWILPEGLYGSSNSTSINISFSDSPPASEVILKVRAMNDCGGGEASTLDILIEDTPLAPEGVYGPDSVCTTTDTIVAFNVVNALPGMDYEWRILPAEAGTIPGTGPESNVYFVKNWEGPAVVIARAVNDCGHSEWSGSYSVFAFTCVGINEVSGGAFNMMIFPNPARDRLYIHYQYSGENRAGTLRIFDIYGREMLNIPLSADEMNLSVNTSNYPAGMYIINFTDGRDMMTSRKFMISH